jgi:hypothetical protein
MHPNPTRTGNLATPNAEGPIGPNADLTHDQLLGSSWVIEGRAVSICWYALY